MSKTRRKGAKKEVDVEMARFTCNDVSVAELQRSVEQVIRKHKKVFDKLAKS